MFANARKVARWPNHEWLVSVPKKTFDKKVSCCIKKFFRATYKYQMFPFHAFHLKLNEVNLIANLIRKSFTEMLKALLELLSLL